MNNKKAGFFIFFATLLFFSVDAMSDSWVEPRDYFDAESSKPAKYRWRPQVSGNGYASIYYDAVDDNHYGYIRSTTGWAGLGRDFPLDLERMGPDGKCYASIYARKITPADSPLTFRVEVLDPATWRYITPRVDHVITRDSYEVYGTRVFWKPTGDTVHIRFVVGIDSGVNRVHIDRLQVSCGTFSR